MPEQPSILIVDDEPKICQFLEVLLRREGYATQAVHRAEEALLRLQNAPPSLIITDLKMPGMDGFAFVEQVKTLCADVPIVMITGYATLETAVKALRIGVDDYVTKPFDVEELRKVIKNLLQSRRVEKVEEENQRLLTLLEQVHQELTAYKGALRKPAAAPVKPPAPKVQPPTDHEVSSDELPDLLRNVLEMVQGHLDAEMVSIMLCYGETLEVRACEPARARKLLGAAGRLGKGVAGFVAREQKPLLVRNRRDQAAVPASVVHDYLSASFLCVPIVQGNRTLGVINVAQRRDLTPFAEADAEFVQSVAAQVAPVIAQAVTYYGLAARCRNVLRSLTEMYENKDIHLRRHSERVAQYARALAEAEGVTAEDLETLEHAAHLHDLGKISVPSDVLGKQTALSSEEREELRRHPVLGADLAEQIDLLRNAAPIIRHHHERVDGTGYPDGLRGDAIPRLARMLSLADAYDAMTSSRPYRAPLSPEAASHEIRKAAGLQFDAELARMFCEKVVAADR